MGQAGSNGRLEISQAPTGDHTVEVVAKPYQDFKEKVTLSPGRVLTMTPNLLASTARRAQTRGGKLQRNSPRRVRQGSVPSEWREGLVRLSHCRGQEGRIRRFWGRGFISRSPAPSAMSSILPQRLKTCGFFRMPCPSSDERVRLVAQCFVMYATCWQLGQNPLSPRGPHSRVP